MPIVESGTSVAPRQRPKGSTAVHGPNPLGLGLPPSPSPRNNITSPQPQQQPIVEQFQANFPQLAPPVAPPLQQPTATTTVSAATVVMPATTPQTSAIVVAASPTVAPPPPPPSQLTQQTVNQTGITNTATIAAQQQQQPPTEVLNSLFESSVYPDPFSENAPIAMKNTTVDTVACSSGLGVGVGVGLGLGVGGLGDGLDNIAVSSLSAHHTTVGNTPTKSSMLTVSGVGPSAGSSGTSGHRRNVSDTSAFNK